jgi:hypothetical protein
MLGELGWCLTVAETMRIFVGKAVKDEAPLIWRPAMDMGNNPHCPDGILTAEAKVAAQNSANTSTGRKFNEPQGCRHVFSRTRTGPYVPRFAVLIDACNLPLPPPLYRP